MKVQKSEEKAFLLFKVASNPFLLGSTICLASAVTVAAMKAGSPNLGLTENKLPCPANRITLPDDALFWPRVESGEMKEGSEEHVKMAIAINCCWNQTTVQA